MCRYLPRHKVFLESKQSESFLHLKESQGESSTPNLFFIFHNNLCVLSNKNPNTCCVQESPDYWWTEIFQTNTNIQFHD